jgi:uncharacterized protein (TIGR02444 family)
MENGGALRDFAFAVYGVDGVSAACLRLQDRFGLDVNLVLAAAYLSAVRGRVLVPDALTRLAEAVSPWHDDVVRPLREVRRRLKAGPPPAPDSRTQTLRDRLKALELEAEMIELSELGDAVERIELPVGSGTAVDRAASAIGVVVAAGAEQSLTEADRAAIDTIAAAAATTGLPT